MTTRRFLTVVSALAAAAAVAVAVAVAVLTIALVRGDAPDRGVPFPEAMGRMMGGRAGIDADDMRGSGHGEAAYLREMIAHHEDAITAAQELGRSERPAMRSLGRAIVASQSAQVELMHGWSTLWYPDSPRSSDHDPMMPDLTGLDGDDLDCTFLASMVPHHMTAVMMSRALLTRGRAQHRQVVALARTISRDQMREIRWMVSRSAHWCG